MHGRENYLSEYPTDNAISRDAAKSRSRERSNGVGGDPCDKLIFITSWVAALSIGRRSGTSYFAQCTRTLSSFIPRNDGDRTAYHLSRLKTKQNSTREPIAILPRRLGIACGGDQPGRIFMQGCITQVFLRMNR